MRKTLLIIVILTCSFNVYSQDGLYGVRAGLNISNLDFDPSPSFSNKHRNGFAFGFFAEFELSDEFLLMPELQFSSEGAKDKSLRLDYIQAPILVKYRITDKIFAGIGPTIGVKVHEENDGIKNFALSGTLGAEYAITNTFFIDARYTYGFTNVIDKEASIKARNTNIQIGIGYKM